MTRSAFTVFSALAVPCDKASGGCGAAIGKRCTSKRGLEMAHCHTSRRKAADERRAREVLESHGLTEGLLAVIEKPTERFLARHPEWPREANPTIAGVDLASGKDRAAIMCLSCYRDDREHVSGVLAEVEKHQVKPFFTPPAEPIPPEYYHNVAGRDGIFMNIPSTQAPHYCRFCYRAQGHCICLDPPDFLPMREPLQARVPDVNLDDRFCGSCGCQGGVHHGWCKQ